MNPAVGASRRFLAGAAIALFGVAAVPAGAAPFTDLFVFGDSVSDAGNVAASTAVRSPPPPGNTYIPGAPYDFGTFSNGPVWATYFAQALGLEALPSLLGGTNYAFGGARVAGPDDPVPSLTTQVGAFLSGAQGMAPSDALYVVAGVGNDARDTLAAIAQGADPLTAIATGAASYAAAVGALVDQLQAAGAQHILVMNTANLGVTPVMLALDQASPGVAQLASGLSLAFGDALAARLAGKAVDLFDLFAYITSVSQDGPFTNVTDACGAVPLADCSQYAFWDGIHPTTALHAAVAGAVLAQVLAVPEPATWAILALGLVALAWTRRPERRCRR